MKRSTLWFVCLALLVAVWPSVAGASPPTKDPGWRAEYYANPGLYDKPSLTRYEEDINHDWGRGAPARELPADRFSVRWTRTAHFDAGSYKFCVTVDDGVRLWVDGHLIIDQWKVQGATTYCATEQLLAGEHRVQMAYFENTEYAVAKLWWSPGGGPSQPAPPQRPPSQPPSQHPTPQPPTHQPAPQPPHGDWTGQYYDNKGLSGSPALTRTDADLRFDWGLGSPARSLPADNFSVRWTRDVQFSAGTYNFFARTDDGVRLWVDGDLVIDHWRDQPATTYSGKRSLDAGTHRVKVEYYEHTQYASIAVWWNLDGSEPASGPGSPPGTGGGPPMPGDRPGPGDKPAPGGAIVVDNTDAGFLWGGPLKSRHESQDGVGANSYWTYNTTVDPINYGRWTPSLPAPRKYEVLVHMPKRYGTSAKVRYRVLHDGARNDRVVDQNQYSDQWVSLGAYYFNAVHNGKEFVLVYDNTREPHASRTIAFDAVKFVPR
jgi:hypothetical protein